MPASRRFAMMSATALAMACAGRGLSQTQERPSQPWAQTLSDLKPDPKLRFGTLPNGMRYVIRRNVTPPKQVVLRLRIDAGSLVEKDNQRGLAHFMEHMAFNGTKNLPGNELITTLERLGLAFGPDINASTDYDETLYKLNVPRNDEAGLQTALHVMREQVSESLMALSDIDEERGVVAGERRLSEGMQLRLQTAQLGALSSRLAARQPIGDADIIRTAPRERFVEFYDAFYRPSHATLVVVGDVDLDAMETLIRRGFADWTPRAPAPPDEAAGRFQRDRPKVTIFQDPGVPYSVTLWWKRAPDLSPPDRAKRRLDLQRALGLAVLRERLNALTRADTSPFTSASADTNEVYRLLGTAGFSAQFNAGQLEQAIAALDQEQRRVARYGISEDELKRQIDVRRTALRNAATAAATRSSLALAEQLVSDINQRDVSLSPQQDLKLFEEAVRGLTANQVSRSLRGLFTDGEPSVFITTPKPISGGEDYVNRRFAAMRRVAVSPPARQAAKTWPYTDFGPAGVVASRRVIPEIDATLVTFANGTTLAVKQTNFSDNEVLVSATTGLGELGMSATRLDPLVGARNSMVEGGLGKLTAEEVERTLAGRTYGIAGSIGQNRFSWLGSTRPEEIQLQMQVLAAYVTDAALRPATLQHEQAGYALTMERARNTPSGVLALDTAAALSSNDRRTTPPSTQEFDALTMDVIRPRYREATSKGPIHVAVVGDITVDQAIAATASTFGALPPRGPDPVAAPGANVRRFPDGNGVPLRLYHNGDPSQALAFVGWRGPDAVGDRTEVRRAQLMGNVLNLRVLAEIRERLALAYSPTATMLPSLVYKDAGYFLVQAQVAPDKVEAFYAALDTIVRDLQAGPVSQDELDRARGPMVEELYRVRATNNWWLGQLMDLPYVPGQLKNITSQIADLKAVTPADIPALARQYLIPRAAWRASVMPRQAAAATGAPPLNARGGMGS